MNINMCQECKENPGTTKFKISNLLLHLCPVCFNQIMSDMMAIELRPFEIKVFSFEDDHGDNYVINITSLGNSRGIEFEIKNFINDGSEHIISIMGNMECHQNEIWSQLVLKIEGTIHTRYLEMVDCPYGEAQDQLIGDEVAGKIEYDGNRYDEIPRLFIDGKKYTCKEFGRMLSPSGGLRFKLKIHEHKEELMESINK